MKESIASINSKKMFVDSLKRMLQTKPLNKVRMSEIIRDCNVNHKTFYYHFEDIYDLVRYMLDKELIEVLKKFDLAIDYEEAIRFVVKYVTDNRYIINCIYDTLGREQLKRFFEKDFTGLIKKLVDEIIDENKLKISKDCESFIIEIYSDALASMLINYLKNSISSTKDLNKIITYIKAFSKPTIVDALKIANEKKM